MFPAATGPVGGVPVGFPQPDPAPPRTTRPVVAPARIRSSRRLTARLEQLEQRFVPSLAIVPSTRAGASVSLRSGRYGRRITSRRTATARAIGIARLARRAIEARQATDAKAGRRIASRERARTFLIGHTAPITFQGIRSSVGLVKTKRDPATEKTEGDCCENKDDSRSRGDRREHRAAGHRAGWNDSLNLARADSALCFSGLFRRCARRTSSSWTASPAIAGSLPPSGP